MQQAVPVLMAVQHRGPRAAGLEVEASGKGTVETVAA